MRTRPLLLLLLRLGRRSSSFWKNKVDMKRVSCKQARSLFFSLLSFFDEDDEIRFYGVVQVFRFWLIHNLYLLWIPINLLAAFATKLTVLPVLIHCFIQSVHHVKYLLHEIVENEPCLRLLGRDNKNSSSESLALWQFIRLRWWAFK